MSKSFKQVAVLGCGVMGRGIAGFFYELAETVWLYDLNQDVANLALQELSADKHSASDCALQLAHNLSDLTHCELVIEAIAEDLVLKQSLLREVEKCVDGQCLLASNTSSLSISAIASACARPERVVGLHFFNPVRRMRLIELIPALQTEACYLDALHAQLSAGSHEILLASDSPGFIVNHAGRGYGLEALRIWQEQVAEPAQIDALMRAAGFKLGPFELIDLVGLDVSLPVMQAIYTQYYQEPRYQPSVLLNKRVQAGWLGRKSGRGFYTYDQAGKKITEGQTTQSEAQALLNWQCPIWFDQRDEEARRCIPALLLRAGIDPALLESGTQPTEQALILLTPQGEDCSTLATRLGLPAARCLALDSWLEPGQGVVLMSNPATSPSLLQAFADYLKSRDLSVILLQDSAGLVFQRIIANIINIAAEMAQQALASPATIDQAVQLGLAYPYGPLAWGDRLGGMRVYTVLQNLYGCTGEARYRASMWLQRRAQLNLSLLRR